jgi:hypothetical protein
MAAPLCHLNQAKSNGRTPVIDLTFSGGQSDQIQISPDEWDLNCRAMT